MEKTAPPTHVASSVEDLPHVPISACLRESQSSSQYFQEIPQKKLYSYDLRKSATFADKLNNVEDAIIKFLDEAEKRKLAHQLLIKSGLFDMINGGIARLIAEQVNDKEHSDFMKKYVLMEIWTKDEISELEQEFAEMNWDIQVLENENSQMRAELQEIGTSVKVTTQKIPPLIFNNLEESRNNANPISL